MRKEEKNGGWGGMSRGRGGREGEKVGGGWVGGPGITGATTRRRKRRKNSSAMIDEW